MSPRKVLKIGDYDNGEWHIYMLNALSEPKQISAKALKKSMSIR